MILAWIALIVGWIPLAVMVGALVRPVLRVLDMIPPGKTSPPPSISGFISLGVLAILTWIAEEVGVVTTALWVWGTVAVGFLIVVVAGLVNRAHQRERV